MTMLYLGVDQHARQITISLRNNVSDVVLRRQVAFGTRSKTSLPTITRSDLTVDWSTKRQIRSTERKTLKRPNRSEEAIWFVVNRSAER